MSDYFTQEEASENDYKILSIDEFKQLPDYEYYIKRSDCEEFGITDIPDEPDIVVEQDPYPSNLAIRGKFGLSVSEKPFGLYNIKGKIPIYTDFKKLVRDGYSTSYSPIKHLLTEERYVGLYMNPEKRKDVGLIFI